MTDNTYQPAKVWTWDKSAGGAFANINRPVSGPTHEKTLPVGKHPLKVTIMLEELLTLGVTGAEYDAWLIRIGDGDQFSSGFVEVNPNSKIPALRDHTHNPPIRVFESGSILLYLAEKFGYFLPQDLAKRTETMSWLFWLQGAAPLLDVLDKQLAQHKFVAGDEYTIADMAIWPWFGNVVLGGVYDAAEFLDAGSYKHVQRWAKEVGERPAVKRGRIVNRINGPLNEQLHERHDASDFETNTEDKRQG